VRPRMTESTPLVRIKTRRAAAGETEAKTEPLRQGSGTGNLLARNLDLLLEEADAIEVALDGQVRLLDLVRITVDDRPPEHFTVMAGIGADAMIMVETDKDLKDMAGSAAYLVAAAKALGRLPVRLTVQLDTDRPVRRHAMLV
jgi:diacylglycerol kinase (ATP)